MRESKKIELRSLWKDIERGMVKLSNQIDKLKVDLHQQAEENKQETKNDPFEDVHQEEECQIMNEETKNQEAHIEESDLTTYDIANQDDPNLMPTLHEEFLDNNIILGSEIKESYQSPLDKNIEKKLYCGNNYFYLDLILMDAQDDLAMPSKFCGNFDILVQGGRWGGKHKRTRHRERWFKEQTYKEKINELEVYIEDDELKYDSSSLLFLINNLAYILVRLVFDPGGRRSKNRVDSFLKKGSMMQEHWRLSNSEYDNLEK